jgi:hypothetical protein
MSDEYLLFSGSAAVIYPPLPVIELVTPFRILLDPGPTIVLAHSRWRATPMGDLHSFSVKKDARYPSITATVLDGNGDPVDVTGAVVVFRMVNRATGAVKVNNVAGSVVDGRKGQIKFDWSAAGYTDTAGVYNAEFLITLFGAEAPIVLPTSGYLTIAVVADLT